MKRTTIVRLLAACLLLVLCTPALAQEDLHALSDPAFDPHRRSPVPFDHDQHNAAGGLEACNTCHHVYVDGKLDPDDDSVGMPCSSCHAPDATSPAPLMRAYHRQCSGCHAQSGKGPVMCGECHKREP